mmetsp:Transcript_8374/g.16761  ORF Transcript_8374/g.16761 Transcript_8374/m.16761 type:complete len:92 (-) Transcript_8374:282-557(-)
MAVRTPPGKAPISAVRTDHEFYFMLAGCTTRILCFFSLAANHQDGIAQDGVRTTHMDTLHMATMERILGWTLSKVYLDFAFLQLVQDLLSS